MEAQEENMMNGSVQRLAASGQSRPAVTVTVPNGATAILQVKEAAEKTKHGATNTSLAPLDITGMLACLVQEGLDTGKTHYTRPAGQPGADLGDIIIADGIAATVEGNQLATADLLETVAEGVARTLVEAAEKRLAVQA